MYAKTRGTSDDPVRRQNKKHDQLCAYDGCANNGTVTSLTRSGMAVLYCQNHYTAAQRIFAK